MDDRMFEGGIRLLRVDGQLEFLSSYAMHADREGVTHTRYSKATIAGRHFSNLDVAPDVERFVAQGVEGSFWIGSMNASSHAVLAVATAAGTETLTGRMLTRWLRPAKAVGTRLLLMGLPLTVLLIGLLVVPYALWFKMKLRRMERGIHQALAAATTEATEAAACQRTSTAAMTA